MDLRVVAGYVAKFLQKTKEKEGLVESVFEESNGVSNSTPRPLFEQLPDNTCPNGRLGPRRLRGHDGEEKSMPTSPAAAFLGTSSSNDFGSSELTSTSGLDHELLEKYGSNEDYNVLSSSTLPRGFPMKSNYKESSGDRIKGNKEESDKPSHRNKTTIRSKNLRRNPVKPLSSLDSCLIAHLYNEHVEMEEYVFSSFPSPSASTVRPLLVTDGSRIISRANSDSCSMQCKLYKEDSVYSGVKEIVAGVPSLPGITQLQLPKRTKQKRGREFRGGRLTSRNTQVPGNQLHSQGPSDRMFVFCLGITFGVLSTVMANKTEVDKLNELLKQTESLVQDLQEELEMKDSLTVKVLTHEGCESQDNNDHCFANQAVTSSPARETYESVEYDIERTMDQNSSENMESRSKIEAELEAELERLELNIMERRLTDLVELFPDSLADIVQGELRVDMVNGEAGNRIDSSDMSGTSTTHRENVNYAVSPQELSLRLHEVVRSRLEERIVELETALESSQKRLQSVEPKQMSWRNYSASEIGSSSQASPVTREESNPMTEPLFLNLSDDALDAYNEAYEALSTRITERDEESPRLMAYKKSNLVKEDLHSSDRSVLWSQNEGEENGSGSNGAIETEDESDDDEMARLLIKQLVEKTRQGSPVVFNAQRKLFSMDEKSQLK
ncbi:hypothetical protein AQUCO_00900149v1 [Aquilegia coerulea]|uniref:Uncharacterized protein n=1 Tax=Aquilegia coerulea TaxID=218851 RepID=A0A2G5EC85_AQUCA|nr:hypothetical protein AQUCO_00900149v1 [Aquilegia coerulea]